MRKNIVVIGAGVIGRKHAETALLSPLWKLVGIAEPAPAGKQYAERLGVPWHSDTCSLLDAARPDAAVIATPNETHRQVALACIERRIPVILEKPIAGTLEDANEIVAASERSGVPVLVGHHRRYNAIVTRARALISAGLLGQLTNVSVLYTFYKPPEYFDAEWRRGPEAGPVLINLIHEIDLVRHLCGEIETVQALTSHAARGFEVEDTAAVILRLAGGALVTMSLSDSAVAPWSWDLATREYEGYPSQPAPVHTHFLSGTEGSLTLPTLEHWSYRGRKSWHEPISRDEIAIERVDPYLEQLKHFHRVIRGEEPPRISAADGAATLRATLAIRAAAQLTRVDGG